MKSAWGNIYRTVARYSKALVRRAQKSRPVVWWQQQDKKHGWRWRAANLAAALLMLLSVVIPTAENFIIGQRYKLSNDTLALVGKNNQALSGKLKYNTETQVYEFNKDAVKEFNPADALKKQVGGGGAKSKQLYALDVAADPKKGVVYHDVNSQLNFKMIPEFDALSGKVEKGRLVFPLFGNAQAVYTLKNNGLKEDIVVEKATNDTLRFDYKLELPKSLEARMIPGGDGAVGVYAADPSLYGNMSYGSDKDRALVEKARQNAKKGYLVFGIPAPVITAKDGKKGISRAHFELHGDRLSIVAEKLTGIKGAFSIDPTVVITSATDFSVGNNEGNIDFSTSGQIGRGGLSGGSLNTWHFTDNGVDRGTTQNAGSGAANGLINKRYDHATLVQDGYMYVLGGNVGTGNATTSIEYAQINSDGTVGVWTSNPTALSVARYNFAAVIYNGYVYISGGININGTALLNDVLYAPISPTTHQIGGWNSAGSGGTFTTARMLHAMVAYNGYAYIINGCTSNTSCNTASPVAVTYCAVINADGTLSSWNTSCGATTTTGRFGFGYTVYNGYIYLSGGCTSVSFGSCNVTTNNTEYAPITSNGTVGAWVISPNLFATARNGANLAVAGGYLYMSGSDGNVNSQDVQYTPIYADGSIGVWRATTNINVTRADRGFVAYGNYVYTVGGCNSGSPNCNAGSGVQNDVQFAKIDSPGTIGAYGTGSNNTDNRSGAATVAYNGWLYISGGDGLLTSVKRAQLNTNGWGDTLTWGNAGVGGAANDFKFGRMAHVMMASNGYMYIIGGLRNNGAAPLDCDSTAPNTVQYCEDVQYAPINADGTLGTWNLTSDATSTNSDGATYSGRSFGASNGADNLPSKIARGRSGLAGVVYNGYLIVIGGRNNTAASDYVVAEVDYAPICTGTNTTGGCKSTSLPGTVGAWMMSNYSMSLQRDRLAAVTYGGNVYVFGGTNVPNITGRLNSSEYTSVDNIINGASPATWANACTGGCTDFTNARVGLSAAVSNGYVYITGGAFNTGTNVYNDTQYAKINPSDGSLVSWTTSPQTFTGRTFHKSFVYNGFLYAVGGCTSTSTNLTVDPNPQNCTTYATTVQYAPINNGGGGNIGSWTTNTNSLLNIRRTISSVAYNGYLYVLGGKNGATSYNDVLFAPINSDGSIGVWQYTFNSTASATNPSNLGFTGARIGFPAIAYNGYMYIVGGRTSGPDMNDTQYARINPDGTLGTWQASSSFAVPRYSHSGFAYNGYLYINGGFHSPANTSCSVASSNFCSDVQYAPINADGTVGAWHFTHNSTDDGTTFVAGLPYTLSGHQSLANGGYAYVLGGLDGVNIRNDVQYAQINGNGTIGTWQATTSFNTPRYLFSANISNGYIYLAGGNTGAPSYLGDVQHASLASNGTIGRWQHSGAGFSTARSELRSEIYNGYLYTLAGFDGTSSKSDVQYAPVRATPRIARWSKLIDLGLRSNLRSITYTGNIANGNASVSYKASLNTDWSSSASGAANYIASTRCQGVNNIRYILVTVTLDDSARASYVDADGSIGNVADLTLEYEPSRPPQNRLRLGQTLQNGNLSDLDICKI